MNLFVITGFIGPQEIIIILIIVLLLFGGRKIPELMKGLGKGMRMTIWLTQNPNRGKLKNR